MYVDIDQIERSPWWPKKDGPQPTDEQVALAEQTLMVTPVVVRKKQDAGRARATYEIVDNEISWVVAQRAGIYQVPVSVVNFSRREAEAYVTMQHRVQCPAPDSEEHREEHPPVARELISGADRASRARKYKEELEAIEAGYTELERTSLAYQRKRGRRPTLSIIARKHGVSVAAVKHHLNLLELPTEVQEDVAAGRICFSVAKELHGVPRQALHSLHAQIKTENLSVFDVREAVKEIKGTGVRVRVKKDDPNIRRFERQLTESTGGLARVKHRRDGSGKLVIEYVNPDHLDDLLKRPLKPSDT